MNRYKGIDTLKTNSGNFYTSLISNERNKLSLIDKPVLQFLDIDVLIYILFNESGYCRYYLGGVLEERYIHSHYNKYLQPEIDFLINLKKAIDKEINKRKGKVSAHNVKKDLIDQLTNAINDLETHINNKKESII